MAVGSGAPRPEFCMLQITLLFLRMSYPGTPESIDGQTNQFQSITYTTEYIMLCVQK